MFEHLSIYFTVLLFAVLCHYLIPRNYATARQLSLAFWSFFFILFISPLVLSAVIIASILISLYVTGSNFISLRKGAWLFTGVAVAGLVGQRLATDLGAAETIGFSYLIIKFVGAIWTLKKDQQARAEYRFIDGVTLLLFFPIFSAGPIERLSTFSYRKFSNELELNNFIIGIYRILAGIFKSAFVCGTLITPMLVDLRPVMFTSTASAWLYLYLNFLFVYFSFSGYSDIAIGSGKLFGLNIAENFRFPLISSSVQEFWQRWHLSLSRFLTEFLFRPLLFKFRGKVAPAIIIAFITVGFWHSFSVGYLLWGVGHGLMMVINRSTGKFISQHGYFSSQLGGLTKKLIGIMFTITYVAFLSSVANVGDLDDINRLIQTLFKI